MRHKYQSIIADISTGIQNGEYPIGKKLPSLRSMAKASGCALSVVIQAYRELEIQGIIKANQKSGYVPLMPKSKFTEGRMSYLQKSTIRSRGAVAHSIIGQVIELGLRRDILPFACGMPDETLLPISQLKKYLQKTARLWPGLISEYAPSQGSLNLRKQISRLMQARGVTCAAEEIVITNGCMEALVLVFRSLLKPGDIVAMECPAFFGVLPILKELNCKILELPTSETSGIDLQAFETAAKEESIKACIVSGTVQSPLGFSMPAAKKIKLLALCKRFQIKLIEDDVYSEAQFEPNQSLPLRHFSPGDNVIYCSSFSKSTAPGFRIGWVLPGTELEKIQKMKMSETLGGPVLLQESMAMFLEAGGYFYHLRKFRKTISNNCFQYRRTILNAFPAGTRVSNPTGGFFLWVELPTKKSVQPLLALAIDHGLSFVPGEAFSSSGRCKNCLRIYFGSAFTKKIEFGLQRLGTLITEFL